MRYLVALVLGIPFLFAEAFGFMVVVGTVHGEWLHDMPTIGYWAAVRVCLAVTLLTCICSAALGVAKAVLGDE